MKRSGRNNLAGGAFTLVELLVVMLIMTILIVLALPAFSTLTRSNAQTQAEESLKNALRTASDAALSAGEGNDVAAVFVYPVGGPLQIVMCRRASSDQIEDTVGSAGTDTVMRDVFVPDTGGLTFSMPSGYTVRGKAVRGQIGAYSSGNGRTDWYAKNAGGTIYRDDEPEWVFPETHFFKHVYGTGGITQDDGLDRNTFMMRFEGGTGKLMVGVDPALVVLQRRSNTGRDAAPWAANRLNENENLGQIVRRILGDASLTNDDRRKLLGHQSSDMVLAGSVSLVALYDENRLAGALGVKVDRQTGCLYQTGAASTTLADRVTAFGSKDAPVDKIGPYLVPEANTPGRWGAYATFAEAVEGWILGDTNLNKKFGESKVMAGGQGGGGATTVDVPQAKVFRIDRTLGEPVELSPPAVNLEQQ